MTAMLRLAPGTAPRNGLTWKPYRYNGTGGDTLTGWMDATPVKLPPGRPVTQPCGTPAAYKRHQRRGEQPCEACRAAKSIENEKRNRDRRSSRLLQPHGTTAAYRRHLRSGEKACEACLEAVRIEYRYTRGSEAKATREGTAS